MEYVNVWYLTDNEDGKKVAQALREMGLKLSMVEGSTFRGLKMSQDDINIFVVDIKERDMPDIMGMLREDLRLIDCLKFVILYKKQIRKAMNMAMNLSHVEFISRPLDKREFSLLLEKSIVLERYREMMRHVSQDMETRIEAYENLMDINRKNVFITDKEKEAFEKIMEYEKHLSMEQGKLNRAIKEFTLMRQVDMFDIENRIRAEEMLADLRRKELMDAKSVIKAQESVLEYSSKELRDANEIIDATEKVIELSRVEAMELHGTLKQEQDRSRQLDEENRRIRQEIDRLKQELNSRKKE